MIVVSVPDPAIIGNAMGIMLPVFSLGSFFNNSIPKIISKPIIKITMEPARAKDLISTPNRLRKFSPKNRNITPFEIAMLNNLSRIIPVLIAPDLKIRH